MRCASHATEKLNAEAIYLETSKICINVNYIRIAKKIFFTSAEKEKKYEKIHGLIHINFLYEQRLQAAPQSLSRILMLFYKSGSLNFQADRKQKYRKWQG